METFSALLALCAGNSPVLGPVTRSFVVFFDLRLNQQLSKRGRRRWFETPSRPLWRHCNAQRIDDVCSEAVTEYNNKQERHGRWCIFDTGWSNWIDYLVKENMIKVTRPGSNQIILVNELKIVAKSQSDLLKLITNSSAKFKVDPVSGVYAKWYHRIGTNNANSAEGDH